MYKKMQKLITFILLCVLALNNAAYAQEIAKEPTPKAIEASQSKVVVNKNEILKLKFAQKFNTKKANVGDKIDFTLADDLISNDGKIALPKGTLFIGVVEKLVNSKSFNRNAHVLITMKQIKLPSGELVNISARVNSKNGELKSPAIANLPKLALEAVLVAGLGLVACTIIITTAIATVATGGLAGIVFIAPATIATGALCVVICSTTKGVNYKAPAGKTIQVLLQDDLNLYLD